MSYRVRGPGLPDGLTPSSLWAFLSSWVRRDGNLHGTQGGCGSGSHQPPLALCSSYTHAVVPSQAQRLGHGRPSPQGLMLLSDPSLGLCSCSVRLRQNLAAKENQAKPSQCGAFPTPEAPEPLALFQGQQGQCRACRSPQGHCSPGVRGLPASTNQTLAGCGHVAAELPKPAKCASSGQKGQRGDRTEGQEAMASRASAQLSSFTRTALPCFGVQLRFPLKWWVFLPGDKSDMNPESPPGQRSLQS